MQPAVLNLKRKEDHWESLWPKKKNSLDTEWHNNQYTAMQMKWNPLLTVE